MDIKDIFQQFEAEIGKFRDIHISRYYSAFIAVSGGRIVGMTDPYMKHCLLAEFFYRSMRHMDRSDTVAIKSAIATAVKEKISRFGFFTGDRNLEIYDVAVPYGASEMMMYAMRKGLIDSAVVVCDGAGTVIVGSSEMVQGIGARMNGLFFTSPIKRVMDRLRERGCHVLSRKAEIKQVEGVKKAVELGYKNIAVTVNGFMDEKLSVIRDIEKRNGVAVTILTVCTTGTGLERIKEINGYADLVWSCASKEIREVTGKRAILQLSQVIPVYVMTGKGIRLVSGYCSDEKAINGLDLSRQYLISSNSNRGRKIRMGNFDNFLSECKLPERSRKEPH